MSTRDHTPSLLILGTDTGVGKTLVTALLVRKLKSEGVDVHPYKPVASGMVLMNGIPTWEDPFLLAAAAGIPEADVGTYRLTRPLSPHQAARIDGVTIDVERIVSRVAELRANHACVLVEGVGGAMVPLTDEISFLELAQRLDLPVLLVARAGLGTLNHTQLTVEALVNAGLHVAGIVVCDMRDEPSEDEIAAPGELERLTRIPIVGVVPHIPEFDDDYLDPAPLDKYLGAMDLSRLHLPLVDYEQALAADERYVWHPFTPMTEYLAEQPHPLMIVKGSGSILVDTEGNEYIDGVSSLWVTVHGHRVPRIDSAVRRQLGKVAHSTLLGLSNEPSALLAERLSDIAPEGLTRVFYSDSGSTAVEIGLKIAFQYWKQSGRPEKREFVALNEAYHGDTIGSVSLGGIGLFHSIFGPLLFDVHHVPTPYCYRCPCGDSHPGCGLRCLEPLETLLSERGNQIAALVLEPRVQGAAGMLMQPKGWLRRAADLCRAHDVLLVCDEVATGFGRTGEMFACQSEGVQPDIMAVAKGITGGYLPLAVTLTTETIYEAFLGDSSEARTFFHGHTYTGNPLACAAALANLELFEENHVLAGVQERAARLAELLQPLTDLPHVGEIRRAGMMVGIELVRDTTTKEHFDSTLKVGRQVILAAREQGVIIRPLDDVVVLMPPLAIPLPQLERLVGVTRTAIEQTLERLA